MNLALFYKNNVFFNYLLLNSSFSDNLGVFNGKVACSIYLYHYQEKKDMSIDAGFSLLEEIFDQFNSLTPLSFGHGLAGISVALEYLSQHNFLDENIAELLEDVEHNLMDVNYRSSIKELGFEQGLAGYGIYLLHRLDTLKNKSINYSDAQIKETLAICVDEIDQQFCIMIEMKSNRLSNCSIWDGLSGVLLFLIRFQKFEPNNNKANILIERISDLIFNEINQTKFSWDHTHAWFGLLNCCNPMTLEIYLAGFEIYLNKAASKFNDINYTDLAFIAMMIRLLGKKHKILSAVQISDNLRRRIKELLINNTPSVLFPFNQEIKQINLGLKSGLCGTLLPIWSIENNDYRWLSIFGI